METNHFQSLGIEPVLTLDLETLRDSYQKIAAENHPDQGGDKTTFDAINLAYNTLRSPAKRLKHYMELKGIEYDSRGSVTSDLMDLFMSVGETLQKTDAFLRKKSAATTALAKALLEPESMLLQETLGSEISKIEEKQNAYLNRLTDSPEINDLPQITRNLAFLEKWHAQLQQSYAGLF
ncbi:co-chaperone protein HscB [Rubritalea halochordaticola]|uniref:Co-chaperone protein HscB n=1 Tax=Rubritalea halochordaticola TaxID=714537 RepID=A0ABP9UZ34_9BACT